MESTELEEIKSYWNKKYPTVDIIFYPKFDNGKYYGKMLTHNLSFDLSADTVGQLISQGEGFLRALK
jgi:hypothetical protein